MVTDYSSDTSLGHVMNFAGIFSLFFPSSVLDVHAKNTC